MVMVIFSALYQLAKLGLTTYPDRVKGIPPEAGILGEKDQMVSREIALVRLSFLADLHLSA